MVSAATHASRAGSCLGGGWCFRTAATCARAHTPGQAWPHAEAVSERDGHEEGHERPSTERVEGRGAVRAAKEHLGGNPEGPGLRDGAAEPPASERACAGPRRTRHHVCTSALSALATTSRCGARVWAGYSRADHATPALRGSTGARVQRRRTRARPPACAARQPPRARRADAPRNGQPRRHEELDGREGVRGQRHDS
jgi:hypothetical protein